MAQTDIEAKPQFSHPIRQIVMMLMVLILTGIGAFFALPQVFPIFEANPYLNGFIVFAFVIGVFACFWQVWQLIGSVRWIEGFASESDDPGQAPQMLAPLASLLRQRGKRMQINTSSTRSILDSVATRIDEAREITRYIVNILIFLGLLGTFYGLAITVPALVETIRSLAPQDGEGGADVFNRLMTGLESQLGGMGVAFGSSLLGLAGSLIVGLLELFAGHGQNRFYRELEEWLSSITRVGFASSSGEEGGSDTEAAGMVWVMDQLADQVDTMQQTFVSAEHSRAQVDEKLGALSDAISDLAARLEPEKTDTSASTEALLQVAQGQEKIVAALEHRPQHDSGDTEARMRLRSIDVQMLRILEEISAGRQESTTELRTDLRALIEVLQNTGADIRRLRGGLPPEQD